MKTIKITLDTKEDIHIVPIGDVHIGDSLCNMKLLKETIDYIRDTDNCYTILNGDILNCALKSSVSDVYKDTMTPMQQLRVAYDLFSPIKHKILGCSTGNHCDRITKETSVDMMSILMKELGLEDRYVGEAGYMFLHFGEKQQGRKAPMTYTIYFKHGSSGGRTTGAKANKLVDMSCIAVADLFVMNHHHQQLGTKKAIYVPEYGNQALVYKEMNYLMGNSFLDYGGYGEAQGYHPVSNSRCEAILDSKKRKVKVII